MASTKDNSYHSPRTLSQQRLSVANSNSLHKTNSRTHPHPTTTNSHNTSHRIVHRKSTTSSNMSNNSMMTAAVKEAAAGTINSIPISGRKFNSSRSNSSKSSASGLPSPPMSLPTQKIRLTFSGKSEKLEESAIDDDRMDYTGDEEEEEEEEDEHNGSKPPQVRRASEGQQFVKDGKKPSSNDLKCDKCGKGYKHSSCLSKHLWEHTPEWSYTSKLLISKHQQVQLLEAASVLLTMTQDVANISSPTQELCSDRDSPSISSEQNDHLSSTDTTPPPQVDPYNTFSNSLCAIEGYNGHDGQQLSHSYNSVSSTDFFGREIKGSPFFEEKCKLNFYRYPLFSENGRNHEDESLASAVQLLSCSFGSTGNSMPIAKTFPQQIPPSPNLPNHNLDSSYFPSSAFSPGYHPRQPESYTRSEINHHVDVKMENGDITTDDEEFDRRSSGRSDEDDEGVFGRMEE